MIRFHKADLLSRPVFIFALILLLTNDFYFKYAFPSWLSGKLSDFSGLFVFALFWIAFFGRKRMAILGIIALGFIFWKSPAANGIIHFWNSLALYPIARIIDYSDLIALTVLPFAYLYSFKKTQLASPLFIRFSAALSFFAFAATSQAPIPPIEINKEYTIYISKEELLKKLNQQAEENSQCTNTFFAFGQERADTILPYQVNGQGRHVHISARTIFKDTMYKYNSVLKRSTNVIDTIYEHELIDYDSIYLEDKYPFALNFEHIDSTRNDTCCSSAMLYIEAIDSTQSLIQVISFKDARHASMIINRNREIEELALKASLIKYFEQNIIRTLEQ